VRSDVAPGSAAADRHSGGGGGQVPAIVASLWVADDKVTAFRNYEAHVQASAFQ
jgi:hypothetical protein